MNKLLKRLLEWFNRFRPPVDLEPDSPTPPPVHPPPTRKWTRREAWFKATPRKLMCARYVGSTLVVSSYDGKSRKNAWLDTHLNSRWKEAHEGSEETLGPIGLYNGRLYLCAEKGKSILSVGEQGDVRRHARITSDNTYNVAGTIWRDRPVFGGAADQKRNVPSRIYDAETGGMLTSLPLRGLVAGLAVDDKGVLWAAISADGTPGLCSSTGIKITSVKPSSVAYTPRLGLIFGGQDEGKVWSISPDGGAITLLVDLSCSKVNRLVRWGDKVLVAAANPDTFGILHEDGRWELVDRFEDEPKARSGEQFDADIAPGLDGAVIGGRKSPKGAVVYEWSA